MVKEVSKEKLEQLVLKAKLVFRVKLDIQATKVKKVKRVILALLG